MSGGDVLQEAVSGVLLIDKPVGPSSNAVLQRAKRLLGARRAGHTGTLDPLASGLLVIALGEATKFSGGMLDADKSYRALLKLGERTETGDAEGPVVSRAEVKVTRDELLAALERYRGEIEQLPPRYAAIKHRGRPLYEYARRGEHVARTARRVAIRRLVLEKFAGDTVGLFVECSKGTYIRVLAEDIGAALGCGAHLAALERTAVGPFALEQSIRLEALEAILPAERRDRLLPLEALLQSWPRLTLEAPLAAKFRQGRAVPVDCASGGVAVFGQDGNFLGTGQVDPSGTLQPKRLLAPESAPKTAC
ncbi:MAG TPA: tRNA pseudouridine(55) synthase TruB [Burkholderiales bacterium]|nr:tRNA pseudouridine(55) synthase TruB [Burkholderiales bacterium]